MKIVFKIVNQGIINDSYEYSNDLFVHNEDILQIDNKDSKLLKLISMTTSWNEYEEECINDGFFVSIDTNKCHKEYKINKSIPNNFMVFVYEIKQISMEGKR